MKKATRILEHGMSVEQLPNKVLDTFISSVCNKIWPIYIFGDTGVGKTHAMTILYEYSPWTLSRFVELSPAMRGLMEYRSGRTESYSPLIRWMKETDFICIDDIGVRSDSAPQQEALLEILSIRENRPTVITGNHGPKALAENFDARIVSRLIAGVSIHMNGPDRRMQGTRIVKVN